MSGHELAIAAAALGAVVLLDPGGGGASPPMLGKAGAALSAAMAQLRTHVPLAGAAFVVPTNDSADYAFFAMRNALTAKYGEIDANPGQHYPRGLTIAQCLELVDAWLDAFDAGYGAQREDFALLVGGDAGASFQTIGRGMICMAGPFGAATSNLSDLGKAVCALQHWRGTLEEHDESEVSDPHIEETFDRVSTLAGEMDGADFVPDGLGLRNSERGTTFGDVLGGVAYAGKKSAAFVAGIAGDAAGAVVGAVVGSPLFWAAAFAGVAILVLRRPA